MPGRILLLILGLLYGTVSIWASEPDTPHDLLQRSLKTSSATERSILRGQLAKSHPETAEGLFAAAWIAGIDGRVEDCLRLYEAAIKTDGELTVAYLNLALAHERAGRPEKAREIYDEALATAPFDADLVRNGYFVRKEKLDDPEGAARFLDEWQVKVGNLEYAFDFVRGLDAETEGRYFEAEQHYASAISKDAPFEVYERRAALRLNKLSDDSVPTGERFAAISQVMESLLQRDGKEDGDAYLYIGRALRDTLGAGRYALDYLSSGFDLEPSAEAAADVFTQMASKDFEQAREFLEKAATVLPDNYGVKNSLAWMHYQFLADPDRAGELAMEAYGFAPHDEARMDAVLIFGASRQHYGRFSEAHQFYLERLAHPWSTGFRNRLLLMMTDNLIAAQRFDEAKTYIEALRVSGIKSTAWLDRKTKLVEAAIALETARTGSALLPATAWRNGFDPESAPRVLFALNSHTIPAHAYPILDKSAQLLKSEGAGKLVLSVEGYTDLTGNDAGNDTLSMRRAEAVRDYLIQRHGVRAEQLRLSAHGSRFPASSNRDYLGRAQNRRVEIRATDISSLTDVAKPAAQKGSAFSHDGRYAVFGQSPPQLWDLRANARLHNLYRGRTHRFSPDGRYVSAVSSFQEEDGETTNVAYIYEVTSGNTIAQLHEPLEIVDLIWKPDSTAIAFATADGFLKIYDLEARVYSGITRMGPIRIGGPLTWLPDGNTIAGGQHRMSEIVLWDAGTLAQLRRLKGVDWPHALGASPDGRYLVAFDNRMKMSVWDMKRGGVTPRQVDVSMIPLDLQFHPERSSVIFNAKFEASETSLAIMDYVRLLPVAQRSGVGPYMIGLSPQGASLLVAEGSNLMEFDTSTLEIVHAGRELSAGR